MQISGRRVGDAHDVIPLRIGARVGDFEIAGLVHRGDAGFVYTASDPRWPTRIALKEYLPSRLADRMADGYIGVRSLRHQRPFRDGMQGFLGQAGMLAELDEPALLKPLHTWQQHGTAYMAMPLCEGRSLEEAFRDSPPPSEPWLKAMLGPLLDALAALHRVGCHPCDVTPHNVAVGDGGPLLFDPGIVRRVLARSPRGQIAALDQGYAAIEQYSLEPSMPQGPWTDVYAVAAMLHRAITGNPPPSPATRTDSAAIPSLTKGTGGYSEIFVDAVNRGLAVHPQHRPQSIAEFRQALGIRSLEFFAIPIPTEQSTAGIPPMAPARSSEQERASTHASAADVDLATSAHPEIAAARENFDPVRGPRSPPIDEPPPPVSLQTAKKDRLGVSSRIVGAALIVAVLVGFGLQRILSGPERLPRPEDAPPSMTARQTGEQASPDIATPTLAAASNRLPGSTPESIAASTTLATPASTTAATTAPTTASTSESTTASITADPGASVAERAPATNPAATSSKAAAPAPKTGKIQFAIRPWGEIVVDGKKRGVSPPLKELSLSEGRHRIEIRNGTFAGYSGDVDVEAGKGVSIAHSFASR